MVKEKNILVSTTSSLSGLEIKNYLKPISVHVVAGTGFSSDFVASFTDVFGGRSKTYQNQLVSLYNEAIDQLKLTAIKIGANAIIGLQIDMDEISGKGKSMFMITAVGTAVIIDDKKILSNSLNNESAKIDLESIEILKRRRKIIEASKESPIELNEGGWEFVKANKIHEIFDSVLDGYKKVYEKNKHAENLEELYNSIQSYIEVFSDDIKSDLLYNRLMGEKNAHIQEKLCELIEKHNLLDFSYVEKILANENFEIQKLSTELLSYEKFFYDKNDLLEIDKFLERIKVCFPEKGTYGSKKGLFSSKEKEVWNCTCGKTNNTIDEVCGHCHKDIYGFTEQEITPTEIIAILEEKKSLLSELLTIK